MKPRITTYYLPAASEHRIYLVTDVHFEAKHPHELDNIITQARAAAPDNIVIAGDFINYLDDLRTPEAQDFLRQFFKKLAKIAPVYVGIGNHDQMYKNRKFIPEVADREQQVYLDFMNSIPEITLLHNKKVKLSNKSGQNPSKINLIGITLPRNCYQKPFSKATLESTTELQKELKRHARLLKKSKGETNLLLIHSPRRFSPEVIATLPGVDYIITGHMHQGCLPLGLDQVLPGTRGLIAPGYAPLPVRARTPRSAFASLSTNSTSPQAVSTRSPAASVPLTATSAASVNDASEKLLILPAYKTFAHPHRPLNFLFPQSHAILHLTQLVENSPHQ